MKSKWQSLEPKKRIALAAGGIMGALLIVAILLTPSQPVKIATVEKPKPPTQIATGLPGGSSRDLTIEKLAATIEGVKKEQGKKNDEIERETNTIASTTDSVAQKTDSELKQLRDKLAALEANQNKVPSLDDALPEPSPSDGNIMQPVPEQNYGLAHSQDESEEPEDKLRVMVGDAQTIEESHVQQQEIAPPSVYLPPGSNFEGVLLNGMDAPTSSVAQQHPVPSLIRVKSDAILPNRFRYDVRECFVVVSGYGVLSTERAQLRTTTLSCVKTDGTVVEAKIEGYVVGEDGKVGMRGRLVSKQGQILAKSFAAGFASGIAQIMSPLAVPQVNTAPGTTAQFQQPDLNAALTSGTAAGVSKSAQMLSQFYLGVAKEMFPVVEIDAKRRVTIILTNGMDLSMQGGGK